MIRLALALLLLLPVTVQAADSAWVQATISGFEARLVTTAAAKLKPDLVIHVGDYLYRESACLPGNQGCAGSPWATIGPAGRRIFTNPPHRCWRLRPLCWCAAITKTVSAPVRDG